VDISLPLVGVIVVLKIAALTAGGINNRREPKPKAAMAVLMEKLEMACKKLPAIF
jgi:hypothetical protein